MNLKIVGIATLFTASSIMVAGTPTLGAKRLDSKADPSIRSDQGAAGQQGELTTYCWFGKGCGRWCSHACGRA